MSITAATTRVAGACVDVPCLRHVEDSQVPLLGEVRIVRHEQRLPQVGRLRVLDVRPRDERPRHRLGIGLRLQRQHVGAGQIKRGRVTARTPSARRCRAADSGTAAGRNLTMTSPGTYCGCAAERSDSRAFLLGRRRVPTRVALERWRGVWSRRYAFPNMALDGSDREPPGTWSEEANNVSFSIHSRDGTVRDIGWDGAAPNDPDRQDLLLVDETAVRRRRRPVCAISNLHPHRLNTSRSGRSP